MIIKNLTLKEGDRYRFIEFGPSQNLIHSTHNSRGKTTLLRLILYSLGYSIPNTRHIRFEDCIIIATIMTDKGEELQLSRNAAESMQVKTKGNEVTYVLPDQLNEFHRIIFNTEKTSILNNLLGAFYIDQEKGWTLLNRGKVIGNIHFNIEELVRGLSNLEIPDLLEKEKKLKSELMKYKLMFSVAEYKSKVKEQSGSLLVENYEECINIEYEQLLIQQSMLQKELKRLDSAIKDQSAFHKFLSEIKLLIQVNNEQVLVTNDNIVGFNDNTELLRAKRKITASRLQIINSKILDIELQKDKDSEQLAFFKEEQLFQTFDRRIVSLQLDPIRICKERDRLSEKLREVRKEISESTTSNNSVVKSLFSIFDKYASELGIHDNKIKPSYIFTSNLRELSGALLHLTVFAFRLAYIRQIEMIVGIKLPIILDSPSGKEVEHNTVQKMIDILKRDFSDNQVIIASIFDYDLNNPTVIEIDKRLIDQNYNKDLLGTMSI